MRLSKLIELQLRRFLLRALRLVGRRKALTTRSDFENCKFLFIRQDRIGDVLVSTPLIIALKKRFPGAQIDMLLSSNNHFVLENFSTVRKRWIYDKKLASSLRILSGIRRERYDFVIDLMDNPSVTSTIILLLAAAKWNVGLEKDNQYAYDIAVPMLSRRDTHIVDRLAQLLDVFGIESKKEDLNIHYETKPSSDHLIKEFIRKYCKASGGIVGINISAGHDSRFWGVAQYQQLLTNIKRAYPAANRVLLYKSEHESRARQIAEAVPKTIVAPTLTFDEFASMIKHLWILITPDTSAVHLAAAFHIPSVILYVQADSTLRIWDPYRTEFEAAVTSSKTLSALPVHQVNQAFQVLAKRIGYPKHRKGRLAHA